MKIIYSIPVLLLFLFSSCEKDDNCIPLSLADTLVGEWTVLSTGSDIEFTSDGLHIDPEEALVFNPNGTPMSYVVDSNSRLRIQVTIFTPVDYIVTVSDLECDRLVVTVSGLEYELKKK